MSDKERAIEYLKRRAGTLMSKRMVNKVIALLQSNDFAARDAYLYAAKKCERQGGYPAGELADHFRFRAKQEGK